MISERKSDDIPPQMKILNIVILILTHFCSFFSNWSVATPAKWSRTVLECSKIILEFSRAMF